MSASSAGQRRGRQVAARKRSSMTRLYWVLGAVVWAGSRALAALLTHLRSGMGTLAGSGVVGFGMTFRALAVMVVVVALAATDARLALAVVLLYALAYTLELAVALALYFSGEPAR